MCGKAESSGQGQKAEGRRQKPAGRVNSKLRVNGIMGRIKNIFCDESVSRVGNDV